MNKKVTVRQKNMLINDLRMRQQEIDYKENVNDVITELYMDIPIGIKRHGLTVIEICNSLGVTDKFDIIKIRTRICQYAIQKVQEGFPFGGIKNNEKLMQYNFCANYNELMAIQTKKINAIKKNAINLMIHFDEDDLITYAGEKLLKECDKQLSLF